jgi:hypothetical protein
MKRKINHYREYLHVSVRVMRRLKAKTEGSIHLVYTGLRGGLEHLKIETRLRDGRFESVKDECVDLLVYYKR